MSFSNERKAEPPLPEVQKREREGGREGRKEARISSMRF